MTTPDPVAALLAAGQAATPGPLERGWWPGDSQRPVLYQQGTGLAVVESLNYDDNEPFLIAAYDPRLLPALAALVARVAALEAALGPLVEHTPRNDDMPDWFPTKTTTTVGDVRRARALLGEG